MPRTLHKRARGLPFATTTYEADHEGVLRAQLPSRCVFATGAQTCSIFIDHYRERKTGPGYPVAVVGCTVHPYGRYTLYPPGHFPYGRCCVVACRPTGQPILDSENGQPLWQDTLFAAALDAAKGEAWPVEGRWFEAADPRRRQSQGRLLHRAGLLVGVHRQLADSMRERIATRLAVATLTLIGGAGQWVRSWKQRGIAIQTVLAELASDQSLLDRVLAAGAVSGLWSEPQRWDAGRNVWVSKRWPRSRATEHGGQGCARNRGPPPTTMSDPMGPGGM